jgi:hydrogenase expression/formation protein HypE
MGKRLPIQKPFCLKAVLFDFDGTLTYPGALNFSLLKEATGCPLQNPVLEFILDITDHDKKRNAMAALDQLEMEAAKQSKPNKGAEEIVAYLKSKGIFMGIISRNSRGSILKALENFNHICKEHFDVIISRDDPIQPKPSGDGILFAASRLGVSPEEIMVVGDYIFDIEAGNRAGSITVFLETKKNVAQSIKCDFLITHLAELKNIARMGIVLPCGKFPNDLLESFLDGFDFKDPSLLIHPGIGEDTAAIDINNDEVLVLKTDPITFTTNDIGRYAVLINANDIATSGAIPRWMLTTLLFPPNTTPSQIGYVIHEIETMCLQLGITLCGGHTEITDAVTRPVISGMMAGTVKKSALIKKNQMRTGDYILLTKGIAVEGTAIIADEFHERLKKLGLPESLIEKCKGFLSQISILKEAEIATKSGMVTAMHDVTEGGLATALTELSIAGNHNLFIDMAKIMIFPETIKICDLLHLNPLGLLGSGSLIICCKPKAKKQLIAEITAANIAVACVGKVMEPGIGIDSRRGGQPEKWPFFETDELTRLL